MSYFGSGEVLVSPVIETNASTQQSTIEAQRDLISQVPGSGDVRGVWVYEGDLYAFRNNSGGTACDMFKATGSGWSQCDMGTYIEFDEGEIEPLEGDVIYGKTSGASATVISVNILNAAFSTTNPYGKGRIYYKDATGSFQDGETLQIGRLKFDTGTIEFQVNDIITGNYESQRIKNVYLLSGDWDTGNAAGYLLTEYYESTNTFEDNEALSVNGVTYALVNGAQNTTRIDIGTITSDPQTASLLPDGDFEFINYNFRGQEDDMRMYGCDGVNPAFEYNGEYLMPIQTGSISNNPDHIIAHKFHLFMSIPGGSVFHSAPGNPLSYDSAIDGAAEIAMGESVTGFSVEVEDVLTILTRNDTYFLYGSSVANWSLRRFHQGAGAIAKTVQKIERTWFLDDRGITNIFAVQSFGDFQQAVASDKIQPMIDYYVDKVVCSVRVRTKNQYRLYFNDKTGISLTFINRNNLGIMPFMLSHQIVCACSAEDEDGNEILYGGFDDGYVRKLDSGTSFDGEEINAFVRLAFHNYDTPQLKKRFRGVVIELDSTSDETIYLVPDYNYGKSEIPEEDDMSISITGLSDIWQSGFWASQTQELQVTEEARARLNGVGTNMSLIIYTNSTYENPLTLQGAIVEYANRGLKR